MDFVPFGSDNLWNQDISGSPVDSNSSAIINFIGPTVGMHADFGSGQYQGSNIGIPYSVVSRFSNAGRHHVYRLWRRKRSRADASTCKRADRGRSQIRAVAIAMCSSWITAIAFSTSCTVLIPTEMGPGTPRRQQSGIYWPTNSVRGRGLPPMLPACRSFPAWCVTTK